MPASSCRRGGAPPKTVAQVSEHGRPRHGKSDCPRNDDTGSRAVTVWIILGGQAQEAGRNRRCRIGPGSRGGSFRDEFLSRQISVMVYGR
jgi:hypothetical protein